MAVGTGIGLDLSQIEAAIKKADESLVSLHKTGEKTAKGLNEAFDLVKNGNIQDFVSVIERLSNTLSKKGYNHAAQMVKEIADETTNTVDKVNRMTTLMQTITDGGRTSVKNGAIESLKYQLDEALSRLGVLNERLQFYTKGEGSKAVGANVVDTSALQEEANQLRIVVELLQRRLEHEQALAALKQRSGSIQRQQALDSEWTQMERDRTKEIQRQNQMAIETNKAYEQAWDERYRAYARLVEQMWQEDLKYFERQNASAKSNSQQYAADYEARTRFYERWINEEFLKEQEKNKRVAEEKIVEERRINQQISQERIDQLGRESKERLKIEQMIRDTQKRNHDAREKELNDLFREQERQLKAQAHNDSKARQERYKSYTTSYEGAIRTSNRANTLAKEIQAVKNLEAARAKLNKTDADYDAKLRELNNRIAEHNRNIEQATGRAKRLEQQHAKNAKQLTALQNLAGSVGRALAGMFGVQALRGYVNNLLRIRGEFELQHKSLQVLLQDKDKADELWDKTVALAVKSPFRVKDLVTYTKQLAAYRVEADKLYSTNKMLADVSAGLGVDMNRLILAFGQVKAANFLRGTELRQFSEAGVNMLEELSKRYTELEGRMVSVGEVFERVSKRMVSFSDVEAVFHTITSEGGSFYRMQEKQSETLRGMMMNLKDSIDLMFNEIGESNEGLLKGAIERVRDLVDNWRRFVTILQEAGVAFVAMKIPAISKALGSLGTSAYVTSANITKAGLSTTFFGTGIKRLTVGIESLTRALFKNPLFIGGAIAAALLVVVHQFMRHNKEVAELNKKYDELSVRESNRLKKLNDLSEKAKVYNKTIEENEEILSKSAKGTEEYANAEKNLAEARNSNKQLLDTIKKDYPQIYDSIKKNTDGTVDLNAAIEAQNQLLVANIALNEQAKGGKFFDDVATNAKDATVALVGQYSAFAAFQNAVTSKQTNLIGLREIGEITDEQFEKLIGYLNQLSSVQNASEVNTILGAMSNELRGNKEAFNAIITPINNAKNAWAGFGLEAADSWENLKGNLDRMYPSLVHFVNTAKQFTPDKWQQTAAQSISASLSAFGIVDENLLAKVRKYIEDMEGIGELTWTLPPVEYNENDLKDWRATIWQAIKAVNDSLGDDLGQNKVVISLQDMFELDKENIFKNLSEQVSTAAKNIDDTIAAGLIPTQQRFSQAQLDAAEASKPLIKALSDLLAIIEKSSGGNGKDEALEKLKNRINLIKEMNKEYEKLNKTFTKAESLEKVRTAYSNTAESLGLDISNMDFSDKGTIAALEALLGKPEYAANKYVIELQKALDNFNVELGIEAKQGADKKLLSDIQNMFDQYDLSLELKKLNISPNLAKSLFGIESINLADIRKKVQGELDSAKAAGGQEDRVAQLEKDLEKINDMEDKAQVERLKTYLQYTRSAIGERAKIKVEEMNKLMEIEETFNKASAKAKTEEDKKRIEEQRKLAIAGVQKESSDKTHELDWDAFRSSDTFVTMFEDLDRASDELLNHAITKIKEFQDQWADMPISDAKEMIDKLNELEMALLDTGKPFEDYRKANQEIENAMLARQIKPDAKSGKSQQALREDIGAENKAMEDMIANSERVVALLEIINNANAETKQAELEKLGINQEYVESLGLSADVLTNSAEANNDIIRDEKNKSKEAQKNIGLNNKVLNQLNKQKDRLEEQADAIGKAQQMANDLYEAFSELAEALGADSDSPAAIFADMGMNMLNTVLNTIQLQLQLHAATIAAQGLGVAMNAAMGVVGWIVMAVQLLAQVITAIVQANDKKIDAQVERLRTQVEELEKKYDKLADTIDEVYSTAALEETSRKLDEIYYKEQRALRQAIAVRKADKNISDDELDEIAEMEEQLLELEEKHAESMKEIISNATDGILDSVKDAARDFTDAWYDAFVETGKGISGLEENFSDMFMNLAKQQASMQITQAFVDKWKRDLSKYVNEKDTELTPEDAKAWAEEVKATFPELSNALEAFLGTIHETVGGLQSSGELSALQKGIQGRTEETAQIIEAYLNSIRGYVSEQVTHTRNIYNILKQATTSDAAAIRVRMVE